ncbi:hypothetical protein ES703_120155 [subsurface metagenome]
MVSEGIVVSDSVAGSLELLPLEPPEGSDHERHGANCDRHEGRPGGQGLSHGQRRRHLREPLGHILRAMPSSRSSAGGGTSWRTCSLKWWRETTVASDQRLTATDGSGFLSGFWNMLEKENGRWIKTRRWLVQSVIWLLLLNGLVTMILYLESDVTVQGPPGSNLGPPSYVDVFFTLMGAMTPFGRRRRHQPLGNGQHQEVQEAEVDKQASELRLLLSRINPAGDHHHHGDRFLGALLGWTDVPRQPVPQEGPRADPVAGGMARVEAFRQLSPTTVVMREKMLVLED